MPDAGSAGVSGAVPSGTSTPLQEAMTAGVGSANDESKQQPAGADADAVVRLQLDALYDAAMMHWASECMDHKAATLKIASIKVVSDMWIVWFDTCVRH